MRYSILVQEIVTRIYEVEIEDAESEQDAVGQWRDGEGVKKVLSEKNQDTDVLDITEV